jgi:ankyrin repeat protein
MDHKLPTQILLVLRGKLHCQDVVQKNLKLGQSNQMKVVEMRRIYLSSLSGIVLIGLLCVVPNSAAADLDHVLFQSIRRGDTELLATFLQQGTPVNLRTADGTTPLMYAAVRGSVESVKLLLKHGADPNAANDAKATALLWCAGDLHKVRLLVDHGASLNVKSDLGNTPLIVAAAHAESTSVVEFLLVHGADLKAKNKRGYTALHSAVGAGNPATVKLLVASFDTSRAIRDLSSSVINAPFSSFRLTISAPVFGRLGLHSKSFSEPRVVMCSHHAIRWFCEDFECFFRF